ncbi:cobalamin-dependent protein [Saccharibacillus sp. CPCC 101409]|uniref:cobalamin B12-binding domain-containing protein n=1 Tax=Saccharibacillus sp. CPCC 101409 TaxID=3058041 RepID=UPI002671D8D1|nr:cobalamin-dependent protein [Saccharibacillus sp. CPCC 101409]MDO3410762.1 cobalamin-dependent protein [Saccharibacillus sp. CPCC 101409]
MTISDGTALFERIDELALAVTEEQYRLQPDLMERYGRPGFEKSRRDTVYTLNYLVEGVIMDSPALFVHYIGWLKQLLAGYGLTEKDIRIKLELILGRVRESVRDEFTDRTVRILEMGILRTAEPAEVPSFLTDRQRLVDEARAYLDALLDSDRQRAYDVVDGLIARGESIRDIYLYMFQATQYEVGRLWQTQRITVAQEHYCTAVTQSAMSRLYPHWIVAVSGKGGGKLLSACVGGEMHEIGLRMLTDLFEMQGWDTCYLGTGISEEKLLDEIAERGTDVVALSATMTFHVHLMKKWIARIRADERLAGVKIMAGGLPFNVDPSLWRQVGADGYAPDADAALSVAARLLELKSGAFGEAGAEGGYEFGS